MKKELFALIVPAILMVLPSSPALGGESIVAPSQQQTSVTLPLPPVPYMATVEWLTAGLGSRPNVELQLGPKIDALGPFLLPSENPLTQFSSRINSLADVNSGDGRETYTIPRE